MERKENAVFFIILLILITGIPFLFTDHYSGKFVQKDLLEDYDYMWEALEENFPLFEAVENHYGIDRRDIYAKYRNELLNWKGADLTEFYYLLSAYLSEFHYVGHLSLSDISIVHLHQDMLANNVNKNTEEVKVYGKKRVKQAYHYLEQAFGETGSLVEEGKQSGIAEQKIRLDSQWGIPVISISSFACADTDENERMIHELNYVLYQCRQAEEIVIDLRGNSGGSTAVWQYVLLPYLGEDEITITAYYACMNGTINQRMFPIDFLREQVYSSEGNDRSGTFEIECHPLNDSANIEEITGTTMEALHTSELKRCDLFLKVTQRIIFTSEQRWAANGKLWVFIDEHTASAAMDMAWILQKAGLATVLGPEDSGFIGGFLLPPSQASLMLPNSGLVVRYSPYYIMNDDGSCTEFGMPPDIIEDNMEFWLWEKQR